MAEAKPKTKKPTPKRTAAKQPQPKPEPGLGDMRDKQKSRVVGALIDRMNKQMTNKKTGEYIGRIYRASEVLPSFNLRRPTGILSLDVAIRGGVPGGCISEFIGKDSTGKSTLGNLVMVENQFIYGSQSAVALATVEGQYDKDHARESGARIAYSNAELDDLERRKNVKLDPQLRKDMLIDEVGVVVEVRGATAEIVLDEVLELAASNLFQLIILDSVAALLPETEDEGSIGDQRPANSARLMTKFCRKWSGIQALDKNNKRRFNTTSLVVTNQFRVKMGASPRPGMIVMEHPGGHGLKHTKSLSVKLVATKRDVFEDKETHVKRGKITHWEILKQKHGGHEGDVGQYRYFYKTHQVDVAYDAFETALNCGVIARKGPSHYQWGEEGYHGQDAIIQVLRTRTRREQLRQEVFEAKGIRCLIGT